MDLVANLSPDEQNWPLTFVGGTADLDAVAMVDAPEQATQSNGCWPLPMMAVGDRAWVAEIKGNHRMVRRLTDLGIVPGMELTVVNRAESGSVIVGLQGCRLGLGAGMAHRVMVTTVPQEVSRSSSIETSTSDVTGTPNMTTTTLNLGSLAVGQSGRILGYEPGGRAYRGKLLAMGLTPGTHFTVTRQAPMGDPVEIEVRGFKLSLRKGEAAALQIEAIEVES